jgi:SAM-dependent methyltransferase
MRHVFTKGACRYFPCDGCALLAVHPVPSPVELDELYERAYSEQAEAARVLAAREELLRSTARRRLEVVRRHAVGTRWLEVGCSTGHFLEEASRAGLDAAGLDISTGAVELARRKGLKAQAGTLERLVTDGLYDVVAAFDVIEHVPDPGGFLRLARRCLRPGGLLALTTPDTRSLTCRLMGRAWYFYIPHVHLFHFNRSNLGRLLERVGFEVLDTARAWKSVTYDHVLEQLGLRNPIAHRAWALAGPPLPRTWRRRVFRVPLGEMMVLARRRRAES